MAEWLFEIRSEEIPSRMQQKAQKQLKTLADAALREHKLSFGVISTYVTPRRLTLLVEGLEDHQPDRTEERRGPRTNAPQQAIGGFLASTGLKRDQCEVRDTPKGEFLFAVQQIKGQPMEKVLPEIAISIMDSFHWPKSMRWAAHRHYWVRPIRGLLSIYGGKVTPFSYTGVEASDQTLGHRFLSHKSIDVKDFLDYREKLKVANVILDWQERRDMIEAEVARLAEKAGFEPLEDSALLDEVAGLVEWPKALLGQVDEEFMVLPQEVITTPMRVHQRYFPLRNKGTKELAPRFVVIANTEAKDNGKQITIGNERVLRARLADARFFWEQDQKVPLASYNASLKNVLFHQRLGTMGEKVERIKTLAGWLAQEIGSSKEPVVAAAKLCKADLPTAMVGEFPELQGVMGRYYALNQGESQEVAEAIEQHYWPTVAGGQVPSSMTGLLVGLADRIDSLMGFFAVGIKPTGSKDPFALRRAALGVLSLVAVADETIPLKEAMAQAYSLYDWKSLDQDEVLVQDQAVESLWNFLLDRFKHYLRDQQNSAYDHVDAVLAIAHQTPDFKTLSRRVSALDGFLNTENGSNLLAAYKRASNILRIEERNDNRQYEGEVKEQLLNVPAELFLFEELSARNTPLKVAVEGENFDQVMTILSELRPSVDTFFDMVTVNVDDRDVRENRLELLSMIRNTLHQVADFSKIEM